MGFSVIVNYLWIEWEDYWNRVNDIGIEVLFRIF